MGDQIFEAQIEAHSVYIDLTSLAEWRAIAWVEPAALVLGVVVVALVAAWGTDRRSTAAKIVGRAAPVLVAIIFAVATGLFARYGGQELQGGVQGNPFQVLPELRGRFEGIGALGYAVVGLGFGAMFGVLFDVPAWLDRRFRAQLGRLGLCALVVALGAGAYLMSGEARASGVELTRVGPLPTVFLAEELTLHVGQERAVPEGRVMALGLRGRSVLFFFRLRPLVIDDAGSERDLAALESRQYRRVRLAPKHQAAWRITGSGLRVDEAGGLHIRAPEQPGPFSRTILFERDLVRVAVNISATAIDDSAGALFPLEVGVERVYSRSWRRRRGARHDSGTVRLEVTGDEVVDGFRHLVVVVTDTRPPAADSPPQEPTVETFRLVPWNGSLRQAARPDAARFVELETDADEPSGTFDPDGVPCRLSLFEGYGCGRERT